MPSSPENIPNLEQQASAGSINALVLGIVGSSVTFLGIEAENTNIRGVGIGIGLGLIFAGSGTLVNHCKISREIRAYNQSTDRQYTELIKRFSIEPAVYQELPSPIYDYTKEIPPFDPDDKM